jgi:hypothetical protein
MVRGLPIQLHAPTHCALGKVSHHHTVTALPIAEICMTPRTGQKVCWVDARDASQAQTITIGPEENASCRIYVRSRGEGKAESSPRKMQAGRTEVRALDSHVKCMVTDGVVDEVLLIPNRAAERQRSRKRG